MYGKSTSSIIRHFFTGILSLRICLESPYYLYQILQVSFVHFKRDISPCCIVSTYAYYSSWNDFPIGRMSHQRQLPLLLPKICIKYRKHWKSYASFQLSGQIGLIRAVRNYSPNWQQFPHVWQFSNWFSKNYPNQKKLSSLVFKPKKGILVLVND